MKNFDSAFARKRNKEVKESINFDNFIFRSLSVLSLAEMTAFQSHLLDLAQMFKEIFSKNLRFWQFHKFQFADMVLLVCVVEKNWKNLEWFSGLSNFALTQFTSAADHPKNPVVFQKRSFLRC